MDEDAMRAELGTRGIGDPDAVIAAAADAGVLLSEDQRAESDAFFQSWTWGPIAAAAFFGYHTDSFASVDDEICRVHATHSPPPPLLSRTTRGMVQLPDPRPGGEVLGDLVARRRSRRAFGDEPVDLAAIADCLHDAFGITGELALDNERSLSLTAAPSPGGLNTHEAVLLVRNVTGLQQGTYRYIPTEQGLAHHCESAVPFDRLFGNQAWCAAASCAIVLVAHFHRQAMRYAFPTTLAATFIEAGARVELLLLRAEEQQMSAVVVGLTGVGAFDMSLAASAGLSSSTSMMVPVCAVLVGPRAGSA
jgi:SagB-type dehydrogenase family enzyme